MTLINNSMLILQHPRAQHARPRPRSLVRVDLVPPPGLVVAVVGRHVGEAVAPVEAAVAVAGARATAPEARLGGGDAGTEDGLVDEAEGCGQDVGGFLIEDGYGVGCVVGEGADLAPVAVFRFRGRGGAVLGGVSGCDGLRWDLRSVPGRGGRNGAVGRGPPWWWS